MYNNFNQNQYGVMPNQMGTQYGQFQTAKMVQPLTPEQIKQLKSSGGNGFNLKVDEIEFLRARCTHKENGNIALIRNNDGTSTCPICGARFTLLDKDAEEVRDITSMIIDVLQSVKTFYLDIPENYVLEYFNMLPYLEKLPQFYDVAIHNFAKYESGSFLNQNNNMYGFQMLNAVTSPGFGNMGMQPQVNPYGAPNMGMQPNMGYAQPQGAYANPFGGGAAMQPQPNMGYGQPQPMAYGQQVQQAAVQTPDVAKSNATEPVRENGGVTQPQVISTKVMSV